MSRWNEILNSLLKKKEDNVSETELPEAPDKDGAIKPTENVDSIAESIATSEDTIELRLGNTENSSVYEDFSARNEEDLPKIPDDSDSLPALNDEKKALYEALLKNMDKIEKTEEAEDETQSETDIEEDYTTYKRRRRGKRTVGHLIFSISVTALIVSAAFLCAGFLINTGREIMGIGKPDTKIVVEVPETASMSRIADIFMDEGIIVNRDLFLFFARVRGLKTIVPGAHEFAANMTYGEIADELQSLAITEEREAVDITFPEGITLLEAAKILDSADICDENDFIRTFNSENFGFDFESLVKTSTLKFYKMEGYCFPDTYRFYSDEDVESIVKKIYRNFNSKITPDYYQRMEDMGLSLDETITFASIVQAEAGNVNDMKNVASVFWNRLNNADEFPLLQSDPTTKYVNNVIMPNIDLQADEMFNAYDTYEGAGLPPGAICNPGLEAITAVLYPSETDYYFFCANIDTGEVYYAETLAEHEENLIIAGLA
ncbi:MAG: endolytic transglycosylase MltG [Ruminococcus sp.]|jgi:UPF0755 protein|nr:endolytic transglycosylase MltG [Ruminococcus sp.]